MPVLAYIFSYKESRKTEANQFIVSTMHGISDKYPKAYENKKDFECVVIEEGDYSNLYLTLEEAQSDFNHEIEDVDDDFFKEEWKKNYSHSLSWEEFKWCWAINGVHLSASIGHQIISDEILYELGLTEQLEEKFKLYQQISNDEYEKSLEDLKSI